MESKHPTTSCFVLPLRARPRSTGARHAADHPATRNLQGTLPQASAHFGKEARPPGLVLHVVPAPQPGTGRPDRARIPAECFTDDLPPSTLLGTTAARYGAWESETAEPNTTC